MRERSRALLILTVCFLIAIVLYFLQQEFTWIDITSLATLLAAIGTLVTALLVFWQVRNSSKSTMGDLTLRFHNDFFLRRRNAEIIRSIEKGEKLRKANGGRFEDEDLDDYLGIIELLALYIQKGLLEKKMVDDMFGYYIVRAYENQEIKSYIQMVRQRLNDSDYYSGTETLARAFGAKM